MKIALVMKITRQSQKIIEAVRKMNPDRVREIRCLSNPHYAMLWARYNNDEPILVVSSNCFSSADCVDDFCSGVELARQVKRENPNTIFLMYSVFPERNEWIDGIIPKFSDDGDDSVVVRLLAGDLEGKTIAEIKKEFPEIT